MANLRDIRKRIKSVKNTQQITKAMKLVSAAKLRRATEAVSNAVVYAGAIDNLIRKVSGGLDLKAHPWITREDRGDKVLYLIISSDRGLCGSLNNNLFKQVAGLKADDEGKGLEVECITVGRKAGDFVKRESYKVSSEIDSIVIAEADYAYCENLTKLFDRLYSDEKYRSIRVFYNQFKSILVQEFADETLFPLPEEEQKETGESGSVYAVEPNAEELLDDIFPKYISNKIYAAILNNNASEHGARMTAMDSATKNAKEMIDDLTLTYNQARQAAITTELTEIISGAESLKG